MSYAPEEKGEGGCGACVPDTSEPRLRDVGSAHADHLDVQAGVRVGKASKSPHFTLGEGASTVSHSSNDGRVLPGGDSLKMVGTSG